MVLDNKNTTVAYRCPECGAGVMSVVGLMKLSSAMVKLKCDCGGSEMTVVYSRDSEGAKVRFTVPCMICPNPHNYTVNSSVFWGKELFVLSCPYTDLSVAMMGEENKVKAELARTELELLDALEESGVDSFSALRGSEEMSDPQVLDIITFVIKDLDDEGKIKCRCADGEEGDYEIEFLPTSLRISCKKCGASKEIETQSLIQAHEFLNIDSLTLE